MAIPLGTLSRFVPSAGAREVELLVRADEAVFEDDACVYLPEADSTRALARALRIPDLLVDPLDDEDPSEQVTFRPKAGSAAATREAAESELRERRLREDHDGRTYVVGWLAFDAAPRGIASLLAMTAGPIVAALAPSILPRVLHARAIAPGTSEIALPDPTAADAWKRAAKALASGALVAIEHREQPLVASAWAMFREGALVVGWCMRGLKDTTRRTSLAARMNEVFAASTNDARCFGAVITCQRTPLRLAQQALAYELLRRTSIFAIHPDAYRARVRSPGWRVLVPRAAAPLAGALPAGVVRREAEAGVVLEVDLADPHALAPAAMDALEAHLGTALGQTKLAP